MSMQTGGAVLLGTILLGMVIGTGYLLGKKMAALLWGTTTVITGLIMLAAMMMAGMFGE